MLVHTTLSQNFYFLYVLHLHGLMPLSISGPMLVDSAVLCLEIVQSSWSDNRTMVVWFNTENWTRALKYASILFILNSSMPAGFYLPILLGYWHRPSESFLLIDSHRLSYFCWSAIWHAQFSFCWYVEPISLIGLRWEYYCNKNIDKIALGFCLKRVLIVFFPFCPEWTNRVDAPPVCERLSWVSMKYSQQLFCQILGACLEEVKYFCSFYAIS